MTIAKLSHLLFLLCIHTILCMENPGVLEIPLQKTLPIKRFPGYYYMYGARPDLYEGAIRSDSPEIVLKEHMNTFANSYGMHECIEEFINFCAALKATQSTLLKRPVQTWTVNDLRKINALLMHTLQAENGSVWPRWYKPGVLRKTNAFISRCTMQQLTKESKHRKAHNLITKLPENGKIAAFLSPDELKIFNEYYTETPHFEEIRSLLQNFLAELNHLKQMNADVFEIAAFAHVQITKIHPFMNGNGRLARIIANVLLMQGGQMPVYCLDRESYETAVENGDKDLRALSTYFKDTSGKLNDLYQKKLGNFPLDLELYPVTMDIEVAKDYIQDAYDTLTVDNPTFEEELGTLKAICCKKLGLTEAICAACGKKDTKLLPLRKCAGCHTLKYCSTVCQKKDRPSHKIDCKK